MSDRRLRRIPVAATYLARVMFSPDDWPTINETPAGMRVVNASWDIERDVLWLLVEHESFDEVEGGQLIPEWRPEFSEVPNPPRCGDGHLSGDICTMAVEHPGPHGARIPGSEEWARWA